MTKEHKTENEDGASDKASTSAERLPRHTEAETRWLDTNPEIETTVGKALQAGAGIQRSGLKEEFSFFIEPLLEKLTKAFPPSWIFRFLEDEFRPPCPQRAKKTQRNEDSRTRERREQREDLAKAFSERIVSSSDDELMKVTQAITKLAVFPLELPSEIQTKLKHKVAYRLAERIDEQWIFQRLSKFHTQPRRAKSSDNVGDKTNS